MELNPDNTQLALIQAPKLRRQLYFDVEKLLDHIDFHQQLME